MKLIYKKGYKDESQLPVREHPAGYVPFREPQDMNKLALVANAIAVVLTLLFGAACLLRGRTAFDGREDFLRHGFIGLYAGFLLMLAACFPHELLHASCFRGEVELYTNLKKGMLFVVGTEDFSRGRFVFMSLLPNLVFGLLPFLLYMIFPRVTVFAGLGALGLGSGAGDYLNVFNCLTQVPRGAKVYMSGMHSYWYK